MSYILGIDLGTTNSCAAVIQNGNPVVIPNYEGERTTPSVVSFTEDKEMLIGGTAKSQSIINPNTIMSIKRKMGSNIKVNVDGELLSPQEISAIILKKIKKDSESFLGEEIKEAVITVPAYFSDAQRQATKDAGRIAGLDVKRIINEPTAAAFAYGLDHEKDQKVLVFDLGGGTFDVSIVAIGGGVIEVLSTSGNNKLGGDDFDQAIMEWMAGEFYRREGINLKEDKSAMQRLKEAAEEAKKTLTYASKADINLPYLTINGDKPAHLSLSLTRSKFDELINPIIKKTEPAINIALDDAGVSPEDISKVLLVGGSTRIPAVQENIKRIIGKEPSRTLNPDECVAIGAAAHGASLAGHENFDLVLVDVTPLTLSIETSDGLSNNVIKRNTTIPVTEKKIYTTAEDNQDNIAIKIVQGERLYAKDNILIGEFILDGILPAKKGLPQIEITFKIDVDGILQVSAQDLTTKRKNGIKITNSNMLSDEEIRQAIDNAKKFEREDKIRKAIAQVEADTYDLADRANMILANQDLEIDDTDREKLRAKVESTLENITFEKQNTSEEIERLVAIKEELEEVFYEISNNLFNEPVEEDIEVEVNMDEEDEEMIKNKAFYDKFTKDMKEGD